MKTLAAFLAKLDKLKFTKIVDGKLVVESGATVVTVGTSLDTNGITDVGVQVTIRITYKGQHLSSWGSESGEDNKVIVDWYNSQRTLIGEIEYQRDRENAAIGKDFWNSL